MSLGQPEQTKNKEKQMKKKHTQRADYKLTKINERPCHEILVFLGGGVGWGEKIYIFVKVIPSYPLLVNS